MFQGHKEKNVTDVEKVIDIEKKEIIDLKEISENQEKEHLIEDTIAFENTKDIDQVSNHSQSSQNLSKFFYFYQGI